MSAGIAAAEAGLRSRLPLQPRGEDVEVGRQRHRPVRAGRTPTGSIQLRYFFLREVPFGQDGNYSHEAIVDRINADLANDLGNLAQRSLSMIAQNCGGAVPTPGAFTQADRGPAWLGRRAAGEGARGDGRFRAAHDARRDLGGGRRGQPLFRLAGALGAAQAGPGPHGDACSTSPPRRCAPSASWPSPSCPTAAGRLLDLLAVPEASRLLAAVGPRAIGWCRACRCRRPAPIFPR